MSLTLTLTSILIERWGGGAKIPSFNFWTLHRSRLEAMTTVCYLKQKKRRLEKVRQCQHANDFPIRLKAQHFHHQSASTSRDVIDQFRPPKQQKVYAEINNLVCSKLFCFVFLSEQRKAEKKVWKNNHLLVLMNVIVVSADEMMKRAKERKKRSRNVLFNPCEHSPSR